MKTLLCTLIALFSSGLFQPCEASIRATGEFLAERDCSAYLSKNRKTNPGAINLVPGERYPIVELNRPEGADWIRLHISGAKPPRRWVSATCGEARYTPDATAGSCTTPGLADSYILALSWQPAFCESHPHKAECKTEGEDDLTLHGLWPNRSGCGKDYGYCGPVSEAQAPDNPCDYPPLPLSPTTRARLEQQMPSSRHATCLQRHQWYKHGTCQTRWNPDRYFSRALELLRQIETSAVGRFLKHRSGQQVATDRFLQLFDQTFGTNAHRHLTLLCHKGKLVELYLQLPRDMGDKRPLKALLGDAPAKFNNRCGTHFLIDEAGFEPSR